VLEKVRKPWLWGRVESQFSQESRPLTKEKEMLRHTAVFALAAIVALGVLTLGAKGPTSLAGSWLVDTRHSDAQLVTDGTTDYGKTKTDITLGFARVGGDLKVDQADPTKSSIHVHIYPATSTADPLEHDGSFRSRWLANRANQTMLCFHSKQVTQTPDGRLQAKGDLGLIRVDRNVELTPSEGYFGPVYGPPIIHRVAREVSFVFDVPTDANAQKNGGIEASASTKVFREDFPQLVKTVLNTNWPPVVQDEHCTVPGPSEAYSGAKCTGTFMQGPSLPEDSGTHIGEDYPGQQNFNAQVGQRLNIVLHMRLQPGGAGERTAAGN
jgi:polyisoprenoid-binding protein YceI